VAVSPRAARVRTLRQVAEQKHKDQHVQREQQQVSF
jgi:hypothetical protein